MQKKKPDAVEERTHITHTQNVSGKLAHPGSTSIRIGHASSEGMILARGKTRGKICPVNDTEQKRNDKKQKRAKSTTMHTKSTTVHTKYKNKVQYLTAMVFYVFMTSKNTAIMTSVATAEQPRGLYTSSPTDEPWT